MNTSLDSIWDPPGTPGTPKSPTAVEGIFSRRLEDIRTEFATLLPAKSGSEFVNRVRPVEGFVQSLYDLLENAARQRSIALALGTVPCRQLAAQLRKFAAELQSRQNRINQQLDSLRQNARSRFSDAGAWAMHFSVVRMTVSTFFITMAWGAISLKWDDFSWSLAAAVCVVWILAAAFLGIFTVQEVKKTRRQKEFQSELQTLGDRRTDATLPVNTTLGIWVPGFVFLLLTVGFFAGLLPAWYQNSQKTPVKWTAIASDGSMDKRQPNSELKSVKFSDWGKKLDGIAAAVAGIKVQATGQSPSSADLSLLIAQTQQIVSSLEAINHTLKECCDKKAHEPPPPSEGPAHKRYRCQCK